MEGRVHRFLFVHWKQFSFLCFSKCCSVFQQVPGENWVSYAALHRCRLWASLRWVMITGAISSLTFLLVLTNVFFFSFWLFQYHQDLKPWDFFSTRSLWKRMLRLLKSSRGISLICFLWGSIIRCSCLTLLTAWMHFRSPMVWYSSPSNFSKSTIISYTKHITWHVSILDHFNVPSTSSHNHLADVPNRSSAEGERSHLKEPATSDRERYADIAWSMFGSFWSILSSTSTRVSMCMCLFMQRPA